MKMIKLLIVMVTVQCCVKATAAGNTAAGRYYTVPVEMLNDDPTGRFKPSAAELTSQSTIVSAQLLVYTRDTGTTAIQLKINSENETSGYILRKSQFPVEAHVAFGSVAELYVPFQPMNRHLEKSSTHLLDLVNVDGTPPRDRLRFSDATGEPLQNIQIEYSTRSRAGSMESTGVATLSEEGVFVVPNPTFYFQNRSWGPTIQLRAIEPISGTSLEINQFSGHIHHSAGTSITLPFLNDWSTSAPGVDVFVGTIYNDDDTPAANTKFRVNAFQYMRPGQDFYGMNEFVSGPEGDFRLAYVKRREPPAGMDLPHLQMRVGDASRESHNLQPGKEIQVRPKRLKEVLVELLDESGIPTDLSTTPVILENSRMHRSPAYLYAYGDHRSHGVALLPEPNQRWTSATLTVPREYIAIAGGYQSKPQMVDINTDKISLSPDLAPFSLSGKITDMHGQPLSNVYVITVDPAVAQLIPRDEMTSVAKLSKWFELTEGDHKKLGAYLTRSGADGSFSISGNSLSVMSVTYVVAEGYSPVLLAQLALWLKLPVRNTQFTGSARYMGSRLNGRYKLGTLQLAKSATVSLSLKEQESTAPRATMPVISAVIESDFLRVKDRSTTTADATTRGYHIWPTNEVVQGDNLTVSVPAETTMTIVVRSNRSGTNKVMEVDVTDPLEPGESKDLGELMPPVMRLREAEGMSTSTTAILPR